MGEKPVKLNKVTRTAVLLAGWVMCMAGLAIGLMREGGPKSEEIWIIVVAVVLVTVLLAGAILVVWKGPLPRLPDGYEKRRVEYSQWHRWQSSLFAWPLSVTCMAFVATLQAGEWLKEPHFPSHVMLMAVFPLWAIASIRALTVAPRGEPGTAERRFFDRLNDELSVQHMAQAHRLGFYAALVGLAGVMITAVAAPRGVIFAVIGAFWLASVTTLVRFGLLQRAAEPAIGEGKR